MVPGGSFWQSGQSVDLLVRDAVLAQQVGDALAGAAGPGGDDGAALLRGPVGGLRLELLEDVLAGAGAGLGEDGAGAAAGVEALGAVGLAVGAEHHAGAERQHEVPVVAVEVERSGGSGR